MSEPSSKGWSGSFRLANGTCRGCGAAILWRRGLYEKSVPLDPEEILALDLRDMFTIRGSKAIAVNSLFRRHRCGEAS